MVGMIASPTAMISKHIIIKFSILYPLFTDSLKQTYSILFNASSIGIFFILLKLKTTTNKYPISIKANISIYLDADITKSNHPLYPCIIAFHTSFITILSSHTLKASGKSSAIVVENIYSPAIFLSVSRASTLDF